MVQAKDITALSRSRLLVVGVNSCARLMVREEGRRA